jgi:hypothetical protein
MTDPIIIDRSELAQFGRNLVHETLIELGIKVNDVSPWIASSRSLYLISHLKFQDKIRKKNIK